MIDEDGLHIGRDVIDEVAPDDAVVRVLTGVVHPHYVLLASEEQFYQPAGIIDSVDLGGLHIEIRSERQSAEGGPRPHKVVGIEVLILMVLQIQHLLVLRDRRITEGVVPYPSVLLVAERLLELDARLAGEAARFPSGEIPHRKLFYGAIAPLHRQEEVEPFILFHGLSYGGVGEALVSDDDPVPYVELPYEFGHRAMIDHIARMDVAAQGALQLQTVGIQEKNILVPSFGRLPRYFGEGVDPAVPLPKRAVYDLAIALVHAVDHPPHEPDDLAAIASHVPVER